MFHPSPSQSSILGKRANVIAFFWSGLGGGGGGEGGGNVIVQYYLPGEYVRSSHKCTALSLW